MDVSSNTMVSKETTIFCRKIFILIVRHGVKKMLREQRTYEVCKYTFCFLFHLVMWFQTISIEFKLVAI